MDLDTCRTLEELEGKKSGEPAYASSLIKTCHELRRKPLKDFTVEDFRVMIGQNIGLKYLVPLALEVLERDPLAEGAYFPGDLLGRVLQADPAFWAQQSALHSRVVEILTKINPLPEELGDAAAKFDPPSS